MRILKVMLASLAMLGVAAVAGIFIALHYFAGASASAPAAAMMAMPVPVTSVVKKTLPIYLDYPGRVELIRNIALEARVSGYIDAQPAADGADVENRGPLIQDRSARPSGGARSGQCAGGARQGVARICRRQFQSRRGIGQKRLRHQGRLRSAGERDASGRGGSGARPCGDRGGDAQSRLYRDPRPFRGQARA